MNKTIDMIEIVDIFKYTIPAQESSIGTITIKTILYKKNNNYSCASGVGDNEWVVYNGQLVDYELAKLYFGNIDNFKNNWV